MAATKATAHGHDKVRVKETHRLGSEAAETEAATWNTFAKAYVRKDGSGYVTVKQNGKIILDYSFGPE